MRLKMKSKPHWQGNQEVSEILGPRGKMAKSIRGFQEDLGRSPYSRGVINKPTLAAASTLSTQKARSEVSLLNPLFTRKGMHVPASVRNLLHVVCSEKQKQSTQTGNICKETIRLYHSRLLQSCDKIK